MNINVIVRVYDRLQDLEICLATIRRYWTRHHYEIILVSNGLKDGYRIPESCRKKVDKTFELETNAGHRRGNSQLLLAGMNGLKEENGYTIILEADTWIFSDKLIDTYIGKMEKEGAVWASAEWIEKYHSLALDFAIARTAFIKDNPALFDFTVHAESHVCNYLRGLGQKYLFITECMPTHLPNLVRCFYNRFEGRNRSFIRALMITHHLEDLPGGLEEKKALANVALGRKEFEVQSQGQRAIRMGNLILRIFEFFVKIAPRSRWIKAKEERAM
jgi:glycosyltransferase involved in cell wall biosynthesis